MDNWKWGAKKDKDLQSRRGESDLNWGWKGEQRFEINLRSRVKVLSY